MATVIQFGWNDGVICGARLFLARTRERKRKKGGENFLFEKKKNLKTCLKISKE